MDSLFHIGLCVLILVSLPAGGGAAAFLTERIMQGDRIGERLGLRFDRNGIKKLVAQCIALNMFLAGLFDVCVHLIASSSCMVASPGWHIPALVGYAEIALFVYVIMVSARERDAQDATNG